MASQTEPLTHIGEEQELDFWKGFVHTDRFIKNWVEAAPNPELDIEVDLLIRGLGAFRTSDDRVRILDVGSGPVSHFSNGFDKEHFELHAADPLADHYNALWDHPRKNDVCIPVACAGEQLSQKFDADYFDLVHIRNAIDHTINPIDVIREAAKITKPNGFVMVHGWENEADHQNYRGMHQWNMRLLNSVGDLLFLDKDQTAYSVADQLGDTVAFARVWNKAKPERRRVWSGVLLRVL